LSEAAVSERAYWLDLFSHKTWTEFLKAGGAVTGFRESRWRTAQRISSGDYFLCYLTGVSRWIGLLEVTGKAFQDQSPIWADDPFPCSLPGEASHCFRTRRSRTDPGIARPANYIPEPTKSARLDRRIAWFSSALEVVRCDRSDRGSGASEIQPN
jgi:hypothetical protein